MTTPSTPPLTPARLALTAGALLYIFGTAAYLAYGYATDTGLSGWLMGWQMQHLDEARAGLTQAANLVVWVAGLVPFLLLLRRVNQAEGYTPPAPGQLPPATERRTRLLMAAVAVAGGIGTYAYFTWADARLAAQPVHQLDLSASGALPAGAELASIRGVLAAGLAFVVEEKKTGQPSTRTTYAPLLPATWEPGQPVRFVVKTKAAAYLDPARGRVLYLDSGQAFLATYDGRLAANDLPTYVAQDFRGRNLRMAEPYYVLDDGEVAGGQATLPGSSRRWVALAIGALVAIIALTQKQSARR